MLNFVHKSIDTLPVWNFNQIQKEGDLRYLYNLKHYDEFPELNKKETKEHNEKILIEKKENGGFVCKVDELEEIFNTIFDEYFIASGGVSDDYKKIKMLENRIAIMECKKALTGDRSYNTFISIRKDELIELKKKTNFISYEEQLTTVEMFRKIEIDDKVMTVRKFCAYMKKMNDHNKLQKELADKAKANARN